MALDTLISLTSLSPLTTTTTVFPSASYTKVLANLSGEVFKNSYNSFIVAAPGVWTSSNSFISSFCDARLQDSALSTLAA